MLNNSQSLIANKIDECKKHSIFLMNSRYSFFLIMSLTLLCIIICYYIFNAKILHFNLLNDQIYYTLETRRLIDFGHFIISNKSQGNGTLILPGLLNTENTRIYMPGDYIFNAIFYKLFSVNSFTVILPNIVAYLSTTALIYYFAYKIYGSKAAVLSAILFIFFPLNIFFALTAMSEMPIIFIGFITFVLITRLPGKLRPFAAPILLACPYLFRQTEAFLLIPVLAYLYDEKDIDKPWHFALFITVSVMIFYCINIWQKHEGLYGINFIQMIEAGHLSYDDAFPSTSINSVFQLAAIFTHHVLANMRQFANNSFTFFPPYKLIRIISIFQIMSFIVISLISGFYSFKKTCFPMSCVIFVLAIFITSITLYTGLLFTLLRMILFTLPFIMIQTAKTIALNFRIRNYLTIYLSLSIIAILTSAYTLKGQDTITHSDTQFLESINPNPQQLLVAPVEFFPEYAYQHYPQLVSFIPHNKKTLILLNKKFPIGTLVISNSQLKTDITTQDIQSIGLHFVNQKTHDGITYTIFKK